MKKLVWLVLTIVMIGLTTPVQAQGSSDSIINYKSEVLLGKDNSATVQESIQYDFGSREGHGIYRNVPVDYQDADGNTYYLNFEYLGTVDERGQKVTAEVNGQNGQMVIKLGDADRFVSGVKTYIISYKLYPIITLKNKQPFFAFDAVGDQWNVPIQRASVIVRLQDDQSLSDVKCFSGSSGSTDQNCLVQESSPPTYTVQNLGPNQGLSIEGYLPESYVDTYLVANQPRPMSKDFKIFLGLVAAAAALVVSGIAVKVARWRREKRRKSKQIVVAEYEPPEGLSPAQIGLLSDNKSDIREITAMLIDLAIRGHLRIEQTSPKRWYKGAAYTLHSLGSNDGLSSDEQSLLQSIFPNQEKTVELKKLDKVKMSSTISNIHKNLKDSLKDKGFYSRISNEPNILEKMLDTGKITDEGAKMWAKVEGFKLYLSVVEKDRLNFTDAPEKTPERFNKLLPYAVALGVEKEWAKQFEGIDLSESTGWYNAPNAYTFSAVALASDLGGSFSSTMSSSSSVGSSGGGGSTGGGFGGGGGGRW